MTFVAQEDCAESGHWWPTKETSEGHWRPGYIHSGQAALIREQHCQRGCGRVRIMKISRSTFQPLVRPQYKWSESRITGLGRPAKSSLRKSQVRRPR